MFILSQNDNNFVPRTCKTTKMKASTFAVTLGLILFSWSAPATRFKTISSQEGISNTAICAIHQNALGHLYIGTMDGLNIWNGNTLKNFVAKDGKNYFYVHWINVASDDPEEAAQAIKGRLEKWIGRIWS